MSIYNTVKYAIVNKKLMVILNSKIYPKSLVKSKSNFDKIYGKISLREKGNQSERNCMSIYNTISNRYCYLKPLLLFTFRVIVID